MLERILQQRRALLLVQDQDKNITLPDFGLIEDVCKVLKPFELFTQQLSNRNESISSVLPVYRCLLNCLRLIGDERVEIASLKNVIKNGLKSRMEPHITKR